MVRIDYTSYIATDLSIKKPRAVQEKIEDTASSARILVVDDDAALRSVIRDALVSFGYQVTEAANGAEALQLCEKEQGRFDLMITDVVMPGMSGRELSARVMESWPTIGVIVTSAYVSDAIVREGVLKEVPFLQKPFRLEALAAIVRGRLRRARSGGQGG